MAEIYGQSSLTITTPQSSGASHDITTRQVDACSLSVKSPDSSFDSKSMLMLRPRQDCRAMFTKDTSSWMRRGWTFQEWLLSPRVLHCGDMVVWNCFEATQYEDRADDRPRIHRGYDRRSRGKVSLACMIGRLRRLKSASYDGPTIPHGIHLADWNEAWSELVEELTSRHFTQPKDKLPALSGLAVRYMKDEFAKEVGSEYLAGIWRYNSETQEDPGPYRSEFPAGLLWRRRDGSPYMIEPPSYRAPSWTWASLDGPVSFMRDMERGQFYHEELSLISHEASCEYRPSGSMSSVTAGRIVADAPIKRAWMANRGEIKATDEVRLATVGFPELEYQGTGWTATFDQAPDQQAEIYLLRVISKSMPGYHEPEVMHWALILKPLRTYKEPATFVRLGVASYKAVLPFSDSREQRESWTASHLHGDWERERVVII
ncbi:hypothetical protein VMCG_04144 [Cytospora schulzeri]|uniref:Heterokaryon incompatibility domain-containing protein n=1 Tax=Cytospora schulzeri TaxID=448051 RepID=A0A423WU23_9PEZI|nr:hypothetical protein VMCG_04144 [Valsa malicola]